MAAVILEDYYHFFFTKQLTEKQSSILMKLTVIIFGIICVSLVYVIEHLGAVLQVLFSNNRHHWIILHFSLDNNEHWVHGEWTITRNVYNGYTPAVGKCKGTKLSISPLFLFRLQYCRAPSWEGLRLWFSWLGCASKLKRQ
jgi:hypothetical protein